MKNILTIVLFLACSYNLLAQIDLNDNEKYCTQYTTIVEIISKDSLANKVIDYKFIKIKINDTIKYGLGGQVMIFDYVKGMLNIDKIYPGDSAGEYLWQKTCREEKDFSNLSIKSTCLKEIIHNEQNPNVEIQFYRKSDNVVFVNASSINNKTSYGKGVFYLFFFTHDDKINQIFKKEFIE